MHRLLIVDDEPLVQIGLKSMLARDFPDVEVLGTASNGAEGLELIRKLQPEIVIADIKMPRMSGLELLKESRRIFGPVPVFIILTAYEEFELAREALSSQAVEYLVKIELNTENLGAALSKAARRVEEHATIREGGGKDALTLEEFRQKFMIRLFNRQIPDEETFRQQAEMLELSFDHDRYIVVYGEILGDMASGNADEEEGEASSVRSRDAGREKRSLILYTSCLNMTREIVERHLPCCTVSNDLRHFSLVFFFDRGQAVADTLAKVQDAIENARTMILKFFNVSLRFGIGTAVQSPMDIAASWEEAKTAQEQTDASSPVLMFSHIVGANRRSGKDRLIASIQDYINENLDGKLQLNEVAEVFGLSPAYLSVIFKKNTDVGFSEYIYTKKIEKAKQMLLSGDMKIYEVADALGFESAFYFSKVFKKVDGHSPREYIQSKEQT